MILRPRKISSTSMFSLLSSALAQVKRLLFIFVFQSWRLVGKIASSATLLAAERGESWPHQTVFEVVVVLLCTSIFPSFGREFNRKKSFDTVSTLSALVSWSSLFIDFLQLPVIFKGFSPYFFADLAEDTWLIGKTLVHESSINVTMLLWNCYWNLLLLQV